MGTELSKGSARMNSKYGSMNDHDLLVIISETTDRQEKHLERINGTVTNHEKRLMKMELRREVEEETGFKPTSKKKKAMEGGMYGGGGALIAGAILAIGKYAGWW